MASPNDDSSFCSIDSFFETGEGYDRIGPATNLNLELLNAAYDGNLDRPKRLMEAGADINYNEYAAFNMCTPLCLAIQFKHIDMISWLLQQPDIDIQKPCCVGTPLNLASQESSQEVVNTQLEHGAQDGTAIVKAKDMQTIDRLLNQGADINAVNEEGCTLLHSVCGTYRDQADMVSKLLERGANAKARDNKGKTPLHCASFSSHVKIAAVLLDQGGADVNASDDRGDTPLIESHQPNMVALLLEKGANVNAQNKERKTILHDLST